MSRCWSILWLGLAWCLAGCASLPRAHDLQQQAARNFGPVHIWKPSNAATASPLALLPPYLLSEQGGGFERPAALAYGPDSTVVVQPDRPTVYVHADTLPVNGRLHARVAYWWFTGKGEPLAVRMTLNSAGAPVIWEAAGGPGREQRIYIAKSLEAAARTAFGGPLPGRALAIEQSRAAAASTVIVRVLEDGPVPMGPMVYVAGVRPEVASVICRCMPAQAREIVGLGEFEIEPAEPLVRGWQAQRGQAMNAALWPVTLNSLDQVLRLPQEF